MKSFVYLTALAMGTLVMGCSSEDEWTRRQPATVPAEGVLTLDGKPVSGATIVVVPVAPGEHAGNGLSDSSGRFSLAAFPSKPGVVPGSYQVRVSKTVEVGAENMVVDLGEDAAHATDQGDTSNLTWANVLPAKYADPASSGIEISIPEEGSSSIQIELTSM